MKRQAKISDVEARLAALRLSYGDLPVRAYSALAAPEDTAAALLMYRLVNHVHKARLHGEDAIIIEGME